MAVAIPLAAIAFSTQSPVISALYSIVAFIVFVSGLLVFIDGFYYENLVEMVKNGDEAEALDRLYKSARLESNNTIIDSDELENIAKKAKIKLNFE